LSCQHGFVASGVDRRMEGNKPARLRCWMEPVGVHAEAIFETASRENIEQRECNLETIAAVLRREYFLVEKCRPG
jgi:hypothetical protein